MIGTSDLIMVAFFTLLAGAIIAPFVLFGIVMCVWNLRKP